MGRWLRPIPISDRDRLLQGIKVTYFNTSRMYHRGNADGYDFTWQGGRVSRVISRGNFVSVYSVLLYNALREIFVRSIRATIYSLFPYNCLTTDLLYTAYDVYNI